MKRFLFICTILMVTFHKTLGENVLLNAYRMSEVEFATYTTFSDWINFSLEHCVTSSCENLSETAYSELQNIATNGTGLGAIRAQNLLRWKYNLPYEPKLILPNLTSQERKAKTQAAPLEKVSVYPNPAKDLVVFDYHLLGNIENATLYILDVSGKVLQSFSMSTTEQQKVLDIQTYSSAMYFYQVRNKDALLASGKFSVQR